MNAHSIVRELVQSVLEDEDEDRKRIDDFISGIKAFKGKHRSFAHTYWNYLKTGRYEPSHKRYGISGSDANDIVGKLHGLHKTGRISDY
jgi:hypothetical protein